MPRYYFLDLVQGNLLLHGDRGAELPDMEAARAKVLSEVAIAPPGDMHTPNDSFILEVRESGSALLAPVREQRQRGPEREASPEESRIRDNQKALTDIAAWIAEQREEIRLLKLRGENTGAAEHILESVSRLLVERLAQQIRQAAGADVDAERGTAAVKGPPKLD